MSTNVKKNISRGDSPARILFASLVGTTIEYFDFYVFGTAASLVFPQLFFTNQDPRVAILQSFLVFGVAFFARPLGSVLFGHLGDKIGRKKTLILSLLTMGLSTAIIGVLPTYETVGFLAPLFLTLCRVGQGLGLGGEWGGAVLLATENAPPEKRGWYAMFPQLGVPFGLILSIGCYLLLSSLLDSEEIFAWGWRVPFIISTFFMLIGLWARLSINETLAFAESSKEEDIGVPIVHLFAQYSRILFLGTFSAASLFLLFYLVSTYLLSYSTHYLGLTFYQALEIQMIGAIFSGISVVVTGRFADRIQRRTLMICSTILTGIYSFGIPYFLNSGLAGIYAMSIIGLMLVGVAYSPMGAVFASPFPTKVRYTGASVIFNLSGIVGAAAAPYVSESLVQHFGTAYVGYYLLLSSFISLICFVGFTNEEISR